MDISFPVISFYYVVVAEVDDVVDGVVDISGGRDVCLEYIVV